MISVVRSQSLPINVVAYLPVSVVVLRESGLRPAHLGVEHVKKSRNEDFPLNKLIEIAGVDQFHK
jgi:hypothetical protein